MGRDSLGQPPKTLNLERIDTDVRDQRRQSLAGSCAEASAGIPEGLIIERRISSAQSTITD